LTLTIVVLGKGSRKPGELTDQAFGVLLSGIPIKWGLYRRTNYE
jgi:hypothetical protein